MAYHSIPVEEPRIQSVHPDLRPDGSWELIDEASDSPP